MTEENNRFPKWATDILWYCLPSLVCSRNCIALQRIPNEVKQMTSFARIAHQTADFTSSWSSAPMASRPTPAAPPSSGSLQVGLRPGGSSSPVKMACLWTPGGGGGLRLGWVVGSSWRERGGGFMIFFNSMTLDIFCTHKIVPNYGLQL